MFKRRKEKKKQEEKINSMISYLEQQIEEINEKLKQDGYVYINNIDNSIQSAKLAADLFGLNVHDSLSEIDKCSIMNFFKRLKQSGVSKEFYEIFACRIPEIVLGALVAKHQMKSQIDGEFPTSNTIAGPVLIESYHLGVGEDWEDIPKIETGRAENWIHSGTKYMDGTAGKPVIFGENLVTVVLGYGTLYETPKISTIQFTIDGKLKPPLRFGTVLKAGQSKYRSFEKAFLWKEDTTVLAQIFASDSKEEVIDYPYLIGVSFVKEPAYRLLDPINFAGSSYECIRAIKEENEK